ncbi:MAG: hypothetical protein HYZ69_03290 [Candidatus Colwellbacteria bacterium]|nr:hypothetical protein [Candidatus Colwellbacteria bacterium]
MAGGETLGGPSESEFMSSFHQSDFISPFRPGENIICKDAGPNNETRFLEKIKKSIEPPLFLGYSESLKKLKRIIMILEKKIMHPLPMHQAPAQGTLLVFRAALVAQYRTIEKLNNETINCDVPWDRITGFPTHTTIIADAQKFCELFRVPPLIEILLRSLRSWTAFSEQEFKCCCGKGWKMRTLFLEVMLNYSFETTENGLMIKQIVGIKSNDRKHLQEHYDQKRGSRVFGDLVIVGEETGEICLKDESRLFLNFLAGWYSDQFEYKEFRERVRLAAGTLKLWQE